MINVAIFARLLLIDSVCNRLWKILTDQLWVRRLQDIVYLNGDSPPPTYQSSSCIESSVQFSRIIKSYLHKVANIVSWPSYLPQGHLWLHYSDNQKIFDMIRTNTIFRGDSSIMQAVVRPKYEKDQNSTSLLVDTSIRTKLGIAQPRLVFIFLNMKQLVLKLK